MSEHLRLTQPCSLQPMLAAIISRLIVLKIIRNAKKCVASDDVFYGYSIFVRRIPKSNIGIACATRVNFNVHKTWMYRFNLSNDPLMFSNRFFHFGD